MVEYAEDEDLIEGLRPDAYVSYLLIYTSNNLIPMITDAGTIEIYLFSWKLPRNYHRDLIRIEREASVT